MLRKLARDRRYSTHDEDTASTREDVASGADSGITPDKAILAFALNGTNDGKIGLAAQEVTSIENPGKTLYSECLIRMIGQDGNPVPAADFIPDLGMIGLLPELDRQVLQLVLDVLESDPSIVLGCNLSADNLVDEASWNRILGHIDDRPELASRLVLEITEAQPIADISLASRLLAKARDRGCTIAVDDFGTGYLSPAQLLALDLDVVKIDSSFLHTVRAGADDTDSLSHMVGLGACVAPVVVMEGIETFEHADAAKAAGATHLQGYLYSCPELVTRQGRPLEYVNQPVRW